MKGALATLAVLGLTQCNSPPPAPPAQPVVIVPAVSVPAPVTSVAPAPAVTVGKPKAPEPPPLRLVSAGAVIVWTEDGRARGGFRSALVEPAPDGARVIAERPEAIFASSKELWVLRVKKMRGLSCTECEKCTTNPPTCKKNEANDSDEPSLQSLRTGRVLEPWQKTFVPSRGCADGMSMDEVSVTLTGAVGPVFFAEVSHMLMGCAMPHPSYEQETLAFDLDAEADVGLGVPKEAEDRLADLAHTALTAEECAMDPTAVPTLYSATAAYGEGGLLHGVYSFTMAAPYMCGTGPGHYSIINTQTSPWIAPELAAYGKLPPFAASYMASHKATFAMPIAPARVADAEKEMARH